MDTKTPTVKINEKERKVLELLVESYHGTDDWGALYMRAIVAGTDFELHQVRRSVRSLARKGYAQYERGLVDEDGMMAGAGYRATEEGAALINPCDICGKRIMYDYQVDEKGEMVMGTKGRRVRECQVHYKQSADRDLQPL